MYDLEEEIAKYEQEMADREANPSTINYTPDMATIQSVGGAQKMIDVFSQEIFIKLQSPVWQDRDNALSTII